MLVTLLRLTLEVFPTGVVIPLYLVEPVLVVPVVCLLPLVVLLAGATLRTMLAEGVLAGTVVRAPELLLLLEPVTTRFPARELTPTDLVTGTDILEDLGLLEALVRG